jgi:2-C-methyl-D-erythritol 4-phosphate cytidylyltransferase / 2-C-methyl-D-erythritol 2,4-cyclodiphosphate synthase
MRVAAIVLAAGTGSRAGFGLPKQFRGIGGEAVLRRSLRLFAAHPRIDLVQAVIGLDHTERFNHAAEGLSKLSEPVAGGVTRQASVFAGLDAVSTQGPSHVLIHDAARPFATADLLDRAIDAAASHGAATPALPVTDTIKRVDARGHVAETIDRSVLRTIQTPQAFAFQPILDAHRRAIAANRTNFPDDAALAEWAGMNVTTFEGEAGNFKLTTPDDFLRAQAIDAQALGDIRTASGFDVHAFGPGDHVFLGGVRIAHSHSLVGHSDADVLLHALTDAILGAIASGDIGHHFPPSDPRWRGAASDQFLRHAAQLVAGRGGRIALLDATVLCEMPKIAPHAETIRRNIAATAGIDADRVSLKATTTERLGFLGRGEGIAAMATATVRLPWSK